MTDTIDAPRLGTARPRHAASTLEHRVLDARAIAALDRGEWDELSRSAIVQNPFYGARHVCAGIETIDAGTGLSGLGIFLPGGRLVGLFLFRPRARIPFPLPAAFSASNVFQYNGTPLVHRDHVPAVVAYWLDLMRMHGTRPLWALRNVDVASPLAAHIFEAARERGIAVRIVDAYQRAFLMRMDGGFDAHLAEVLSKNRLKDVRRTTRRLAEAGVLSLEHATEPELLARRLEDFLTLEHAGWKGAEGTSILSNDKDATFARLAYARTGGAEAVAVDSLLLDERPIAMKLSIRTGDVAFTPKIAYDEAFKKLGPGMVLEYMLLERFYADPGLAGVDAAATAETHSALNFFNGTKPMGTLIVGAGAWQVRLLAGLHEARDAVLSWRKRLKGA